MKHFIAVLALFIALSPALVLAQDTGYQRALASNSESLCQGLHNGSLVESVVFRRIYTNQNPLETAVVVVLDNGGKIDGAVVYTKGGAVFLRQAVLGTQTLGSFQAQDLLTDISDIEQTVRALYAKATQNDSTSTLAAAQLTHAYDLLHNYGDFPCALTKYAIVMQGADGTQTTYPAGSVVFDWNNVHYIYHPDLGVRGTPLPTDPVTGAPYLCVKHGDLVESVAFYYNYRKTHPDEQVTVLAPLPPLRVAGQKFEPGDPSYTWAAAVYTKQGQLYLHSHILGDVLLDKFKPADITHDAQLAAVYKQMLRDKSQGSPANKNGQVPVDIDQAVAFLGTKIPQNLPGDDDDMQLRRVMQMLKSLNGNAAIHWEPGTASSGWKYNYLLIFCEDRAYEYKSFRPTLHRGYRGRLEPNSLVSGLVFLTDYQKSNPQEKTGLVFSPTPKNNTNAWALFTQSGQTYYYNYTIGSFPLSSIASADWNNPAKQSDVITAAYQVHETELHKEWNNRQSISSTQLAAEQQEDKKLEIHAIYNAFQQAGISCQLINERDWGEDGHWHEYPVPTLAFQWQGANYTYNEFHACVRANGYFFARIRLE